MKKFFFLPFLILTCEHEKPESTRCFVQCREWKEKKKCQKYYVPFKEKERQKNNVITVTDSESAGERKCSSYTS